MRVLCSGLVAAMVATLLAVPAGAVEIRAVRLSAGPEGTRVVMDLSSRASHSVMTLKNPDRIVIDGLPRARPGQKVKAEDGTIKAAAAQ